MNNLAFSSMELAELLGKPLITITDWVTKRTITPDLKPASGRGSTRRYSYQATLESGLALHLRDVLGISIHDVRVAVDHARERGVFKGLRPLDGPLPQSLVLRKDIDGVCHPHFFKGGDERVMRGVAKLRKTLGSDHMVSFIMVSLNEVKRQVDTQLATRLSKKVFLICRTGAAPGLPAPN